MIRTGLTLLLGLATFPPAGAMTWTPLTWQGEPALASSAGGWRAVVSLPRARLMYFGPAGTEHNLLLAPPTRDNPDILGGHRLWLGPQAQWRGGWPPPAAWEYRSPERWHEADGVLRLELAESGDGWPRLTRTYRWQGTDLVCGAELAGGNRPAQIIQIFQTPAATVVSGVAAPTAPFPAGYVILPSVAGPFAARFAAPPHVTRTGDSLRFAHHPKAILKIGLRPQPLVGSAGGYTLTVIRGPLHGRAVGEPDEGFLTQAYFGGHEAMVELEQLSPLLAAGEPAGFEVVLRGTAP